MLTFKNFIAEEAQAELDLITEMAVAVVGGEENYGTLDELSRKTLGSYIRKANYDGNIESAQRALNVRDKYANEKSSGSYIDNIKKNIAKAERKIDNRETGIRRATMKLAKEDFDAILKMVEDSTELNELSKNTLGKYIFRSKEDMVRREFSQGRRTASSQPNFDEIQNERKKLDKRNVGFNKALNKLLKKESTEMRAPVSASIEPYKDAHSLHDKAEQHRQIAKQAEHRYFNGGDEVDRVIYHAHMAKHHQLMGEHAVHTDSPEAAKAHTKSVSKNLKMIGTVATNHKNWSE